MSVHLKNTIERVRGYAVKVPGLAQGTEDMFAARSPMGRSIKVFLFSVGVVLPLGSLIWALLLWHGSLAGRPVKAPEAEVLQATDV